MTLRELLDAIATAPLTIDRRSDEYRVLNQAQVDLTVLRHQHGLLREALAKYADPAFYDADLEPTSKASADRGKHAEWVLRLTAPSDDPRSA